MYKKDANARPKKNSHKVVAHQENTYLMCQGPLMGRFGRVQRRCNRQSHKSHYKKTEKRRSCNRMYRNSAQSGKKRRNERRSPRWAKTWANTRRRAIGYEEFVHSKRRKRREPQKTEKTLIMRARTKLYRHDLTILWRLRIFEWSSLQRCQTKQRLWHKTRVETKGRDIRWTGHPTFTHSRGLK